MKGIFGIALAVVVVVMTTSTQGTPFESEFPPPEQGLIRMGGGKSRVLDKSYWLSTFRANQAQAQRYCRQQGYNLLVIRNGDKEKEVQEQYKAFWGTSAPEWVWLNAFKDNAGSDFFYDDQNRLIEYSNFMNNFYSWANGQCIILLGPNGFNSQNQYKWMLQNCTNIGKFICEDN